LVDNNDNGGLDNKGFDYDTLVEESLKNVVKKVLKMTSEDGLLGESHFFISFNSKDPEVVVPSELRGNDNSEIKMRHGESLPDSNDYKVLVDHIMGMVNTDPAKN